jgi:glucosamine kinase
MKLIVDNGSTKADWCFTDENGIIQIIQTDGINPIIQSEQCVKNILQSQLYQQIIKLNIDVQNVSNFFFYGAGCTDSTKDNIASLLRKAINAEAQIQVESDLLGAARALCGHEKGIACILGTGSNSCFFNGEQIELHTPSLGYILGDEGSGAVLGKKFINAIIKGALPHSLCNDFLERNKLTVSDIINNVYKGTAPNRFLASTSVFIGQNIANKQLEELVIENFKDFIQKNIIPYGKEGFPLNAVGSIAYYYQEQFKKAANSFGYQIGKIVKSPIYELATYHK